MSPFGRSCSAPKKPRNPRAGLAEAARVTTPPALTRTQTHTFALGRIGLDLFEVGAFQSARDVFRLLVLDCSTEVSAWYWLARCHQELGEPEKARKLFECAAHAGRSPLFRALARGLGRDR